MESMMFWVEAVIVVMESMLVFWIMQSMFQVRFRKRPLAAAIYLLCLVGAWSLTRSMHWGIKGSVTLLLQILLAVFVFDGEKKRKIVVTLIVSVVVLLVDLLISFIASQTGYVNITSPSDIYYVLSISSRVICASLLGAAVLTYRMRVAQYQSKIKWRTILGYSLIPISAAIFFIEIYRRVDPLQETLIFAFCGLLIVLMYFLSMSLQLNMIEVVQQRSISAFANREMAVRKENYDNAQKLHQEVYKLAHDIKHQITTLRGLYGDSPEAGRYIDEMQTDLNHTLDHYSYGNLVIESLLKGFEQKAKKENIDVELEIDVYGEVYIHMIDISTVLGNIFDNAIESCARITDPQGEKRIKSVVSLQKDKLLIYMENAVGGTVRQEGSRFISSKKDSIQHGIGLVSVEQTIKKYFGTMQAYVQDDIFFFDAFMKNVNREDSMY